MIITSEIDETQVVSLSFCNASQFHLQKIAATANQNTSRRKFNGSFEAFSAIANGLESMFHSFRSWCQLRALWVIYMSNKSKVAHLTKLKV